jgi:hypothetical protein
MESSAVLLPVRAIRAASASAAATAATAARPSRSACASATAWFCSGAPALPSATSAPDSSLGVKSFSGRFGVSAFCALMRASASGDGLPGSPT